MYRRARRTPLAYSSGHRPLITNHESTMKYGAHAFLWQDRYGDEALLRMLDDAEAMGAFVSGSGCRR